MSTIRKLVGALAAAAVLLSIFAGAANAATGTATWYNDSGYGACGTNIDAATQMLVAAPAALWTAPNPNNDPLCGQSIQVTYNGTTLTLPIEDKCPSCDAGHIDLSEPAFQQLADPAIGVITVDWKIVSGGSGGTGGTTAGPITGYAGLCVDDRYASTTNFNPIQIWGCNGTAAQQWTVTYANNTLQVLGKCMDVNSGSTANGATIDLYQCNGTGAQVWVPQANGSLLNPQSNKCLDDTGWSSTPGTQLQIWDCTGGANQQWNLP